MATKKEKIEGDEVVSTPSEEMIPRSIVQDMIDEAIKKSKDPQVLKPKRVTEHHAHVWRFDGKWVVDFVDQNNDPYVKEKIHSVSKFNDQKRQLEAWIELKFNDGTTKAVPLTTYVKSRVLVYCPILKREKLDKSYSMGEVERKKEVGDKLVGTGTLTDQMVERYEEVFEIKTPEGEVLTLPDYVLA